MVMGISRRKHRTGKRGACPRQIWSFMADGERGRPPTRGPGQDSGPRRSPDGSTLAFLSTRHCLRRRRGRGRVRQPTSTECSTGVALGVSGASCQKIQAEAMVMRPMVAKVARKANSAWVCAADAK